jgi:hypothetical protein
VFSSGGVVVVDDAVVDVDVVVYDVVVVVVVHRAHGFGVQASHFRRLDERRYCRQHLVLVFPEVTLKNNKLRLVCYVLTRL